MAKEFRSQLLVNWRYSSFSVVFFVSGPTFLTLGPFLGVTPLRWKKTIRYSDAEFYAASCEKKIFFEKSPSTKNLVRPWKFSGRTLWLLKKNPYFVITIIIIINYPYQKFSKKMEGSRIKRLLSCSGSFKKQ